MRKISYYLFFIIFAGLAISIFWGYERYFKVDEKEPVLFVVSRGVIKETVRVRGEVVSQKDFDLEFPFSGTVDRIFVKEGRTAGAGVPIIKLDTTDLELEVKQFEAQLAQNNASLKKLLAGATSEDINVSLVKVTNAEMSVVDAKKNLINKLEDAYLKSDNATRNHSDQLFSNPRSATPKIIFTISNAQLRSDLETRRLVLEKTLNSWKSSIGKLSFESELEPFINTTNKNMDDVGEFLDRLALAVNGLTKDSTLTQATVDGYKDDISTARSAISAVIVNLSAAEEKLRDKESAYALAVLESELKISGAREEDVVISKAKIQETETKISIIKEKIRKSTLFTPGRVTIEKIWLEEGEVARIGNVIVSLVSLGFKIQADVSELEIGKFDEASGNDVLIELDAFQNRIIFGKVVSIEPRKVVKDGDTYYKVNIYLDTTEKNIRTGMSADLIVSISQSIDVLIVPEIAIQNKDEKYFVMILEDGVIREQEIEVGNSDGENIAIMSGLSSGDVLTIPK